MSFERGRISDTKTRKKREYCSSSGKWGPHEREIQPKEGAHTLGGEKNDKGIRMREREIHKFIKCPEGF